MHLTSRRSGHQAIHGEAAAVEFLNKRALLTRVVT